MKGAKGSPGKPGRDGTPGQKGDDGKEGPRGIPGRDGRDGKDCSKSKCHGKFYNVDCAVVKPGRCFPLPDFCHARSIQHEHKNTNIVIERPGTYLVQYKVTSMGDDDSCKCVVALEFNGQILKDSLSFSADGSNFSGFSLIKVDAECSSVLCLRNISSSCCIKLNKFPKCVPNAQVVITPASC